MLIYITVARLKMHEKNKGNKYISIYIFIYYYIIYIYLYIIYIFLHFPKCLYEIAIVFAIRKI